MLITAQKIAVYRKLADDIDAALGRGDEIGMQMLTAMLPELGESLEEINEALRGIQMLLFEGLRDEAIGLHHPALPEVALRLNLQDKPQWASVGVYLESMGIKPPRAIDFETLTAFNAAFAEVDSLRRPLDKLRRLTLQRAPLPAKISLLRKFKKHDGLKPVWSDQLAAHEELRILELGDSVKRAIDARDAQEAARLHEELTDSGWSIPVPQRLQNETRGADVWWNLRRKVAELELVSRELAERYSEDETHDEEGRGRVDDLRDLRDRWIEGERRCREWLFSLPQFPAISRFAQEEHFGPRLDAIRETVSPAMTWLGQLDRRDAMMRQFETGCNELEYMVDHLPTRKNDEGAWLAKSEKTMVGLQHLCQQMPLLRIPDLLLTRLERATAEVRRRGRARGRNVLVAAICGTLLLGAGVVIVWQILIGRVERARVVQMVNDKLRLAKQGEFVVRPADLDDAVVGYERDGEIVGLLEELDRYAKRERERREEFESLVKKHESLLAVAGETLEDWRKDSTKALSEWPAALFQAQHTYGLMRDKGGFPGNRKADYRKKPEGGSARDEGLPPQVAQQYDTEETSLAQQEATQSRIVAGFENAVVQEFQRQLQSIQDDVALPGNSGNPEIVKQLLTKLEQLVDLAKKPRSESAKSPQRVPYETRKSADRVRTRLETLLE